MAELIARLGDTGTHGGSITTSAAHRKCGGQLIARKGDRYSCALHGPQTITQGSTRWKCEGEPIARHGDLTSCGATLIAGQTKWKA